MLSMHYKHTCQKSKRLGLKLFRKCLLKFFFQLSSQHFPKLFFELFLKKLDFPKDLELILKRIFTSFCFQNRPLKISYFFIFLFNTLISFKSHVKNHGIFLSMKMFSLQPHPPPPHEIFTLKKIF